MQPSSSQAQETVFERTPAGQCALLSEGGSLSSTERRFLALLNGFTPLPDLRALLNDDEVSNGVVQAMASRGLIRIPEHHVQHLFLGWPCARA